MQKGDKNQQDPPITSSKEIRTLWRGGILYSSQQSSHGVGNYSDMVKVLSEVELPSPSPALATSCTLTREENVTRFHEGQTSGAKRKAKDIEGNVEREKELKGKHHDYQQPDPQRIIATGINIKEKRRRYRISERIRALKALVPNCNKRDNASILGDAIEYIKFLQMQLQVMQYMGIGSPSMFPAGQPSLQLPNFAPMRPSINIQHGIPQYGFYIPTNFPICPPYFTGFPQLMPPMEYSWRHPRPLLYPQPLQFPLQSMFQSVCSTTPTPPSSSPTNTITPTTCSQAGSTAIIAQPSYHEPATSQGTQ